MKNKLKKIFFWAILGLLPSGAWGAYSYEPMEAIPGFANVCERLTSAECFPKYVQAIYNFGIWSIGIAALLMISIGAFTYITAAGNTSQTGTGKKIITDAILGLVMVMVAYLLLYTINPDLVNVSINNLDPIGEED